MNDEHLRLLRGRRVLDLTDERGAFAGTLLAMLGAEVILVEPPAGGPTRAAPPFVGDVAGPDRSLVHQVYNRGKRSVVVDLSDQTDRTRFDELLATSDALLETGGPTERSLLGRPDPGTLATEHPHLIHGILSPFGSTGPKADWSATDLVVAASGAQMALNGNDDRAPLRTAVPQTWLHASADLAVGVLVALVGRSASGRGQHVDIAAQQSWTEAGFHYPLLNAWGHEDAFRCGSHVRLGPVASTFDFPAADGHITMTLLFGAAVGPFTNRFVAWMSEEGACTDAIAEVDYTTYVPQRDIAHFETLKRTIGEFTATKSKRELEAAAWDRRLLIAPVATLREVLDRDHFAERASFDTVEIAGASSSIRLPGTYVHTTPRRLAPLSPAPAIGADRAAILAELTCRPESSGDHRSSGDAMRPLAAVARPAGRAADDGPPAPGEPLKVLDLTISFAGPIIGRILAAHGATVVKVESEQRPDLTRTAGPFLGGDTIDHSACFAHYNANKLSLGMNLRRPGATGVLFDLVTWADVLIDSFAPGALARMGLDATTRARLNPSLITMSSSLLGQTGPLAKLAGYGNMAAAICGFFSTTGWPDRSPVGPVGAYTDIISPRFAAAAILAAIDHRERTGEGTDFDFGQGESALHLLSLGMADQQVNGRSWERIGNDDHFCAPHGVYPCAGDDQWIAIVAPDDDAWQQLCRVADASSPGPARPLGDLAGLGTPERLARRRDIEKRIERWTRTIPGPALEADLQAAGVPAHTVQNSAACARDPQLAHRGWTTTAAHARIGELRIGTTSVALSETPAGYARAGPALGQDSYEILHDLLGYEPEQIADLAAGGALE